MYKNLDESTAFKTLQAMSSIKLKEQLHPNRIESYQAKAGCGLRYNYAAMPIADNHLAVLQELSDELQLTQKYQALLDGEVMNTGEKRLVLHHLCRGQIGKTVFADGEDKGSFYQQQLTEIKAFSQAVRNGEIVGSTGKTFTTVVQIGIGGSDLGPRALYLALKGWCSRDKNKQLDAQFISNVDPDDAEQVIRALDLERTLFILVSKSGTTLETLTNRDFVVDAIQKSNIEGLVAEKHMVAVTSNSSPLASSSSVLKAFFIDDYIGGRYSSTSAVGAVVLSLAFGFEIFDELLRGAHEADLSAMNPNIRENGALLDALLGIYLRNVLGYPSTAILPYSQALSRFPAHLQQLDMESNGKHVNREGKQIDYPTGPVIFGEPGTNGQHSFYQLLHQGSDIVPLQFIGFVDSQYQKDVLVEGSTSQTKLNANLVAQIVAFATGKDDKNPNKQFYGERPSSLLWAKELSPSVLGALLAHYENKVMFQGFVWNLNSFDQEGVQLGKVLATKVLRGCEGDEVLKAYSNFFSL